MDYRNQLAQNFDGNHMTVPECRPLNDRPVKSNHHYFEQFNKYLEEQKAKEDLPK